MDVSTKNHNGEKRLSTGSDGLGRFKKKNDAETKKSLSKWVETMGDMERAVYVYRVSL